MPETYTIKLSDGREFDVVTEGGAPTEAAILASLGQSDAPKVGSALSVEKPPHGSIAGLGMSATAKAVPAVVDAVAPVAQRFASSSMVPKAAAAIGGIAGNMAGHGAPVVSGITSKLGEFAGGLVAKGAQKAAGAGAVVLQAAKPYARTLSTLGGIQGWLDLAQMAEPERQDIGTLGIGPTVKAGAIPMTPELVAMPVADAVKSLTDAGWPEARAKSYVTQMRKLMNR